MKTKLILALIFACSSALAVTPEKKLSESEMADLMVSGDYPERANFQAWAKKHDSLQEADLSRSNIAALLARLHIQKVDAIALKSGTVIPLNRVLKLNPVGLSFIDAQGGIAHLPFTDLPQAIIDGTGWTPAIAEMYAKGIAIAPAPPPVPAKHVQQHSKAEDAMLAHVRKHYPGDYSLQEYAYNLELKALAELRPILNHGIAGVPDDVLHAIEMKAFGRWDDGDYEMVLYDIKKETQSYLRLNR